MYSLHFFFFFSNYTRTLIIKEKSFYSLSNFIPPHTHPPSCFSIDTNLITTSFVNEAKYRSCFGKISRAVIVCGRAWPLSGTMGLVCFWRERARFTVKFVSGKWSHRSHLVGFILGVREFIARLLSGLTLHTHEGGKKSSSWNQRTPPTPSLSRAKFIFPGVLQQSHLTVELVRYRSVLRSTYT